MRRRALLAALPAAGSSLALAGCLDRARSTVGLQPEVRTIDPDREPQMLWLFRDLEADSVTRGEPAGTVAVGSGEDAHWLTVAAESADPVETRVTIRPADGDTIHETTVALSSERYFAVRFNFRQDYAVDVETARHEETVEVAEDRVDCNESGHAVLLAADGAVRSIWATTDMECPSRFF